MIEIYEGNTGQGKTYYLSMKLLELAQRNKRWFQKKRTKEVRKIATNIAVADWVKKKYPDIIYWTDLDELVNLRQTDVIFDDMATYLDSQRWTDTPMSVRRWLRLHEHYGCDIYGNAQDFLTIDISVRRLVGELYRITKIIGSRRPYATKPTVKFIWGVLFIRQVDPKQQNKENADRQYIGWPRIEFIHKEVCKVFDTTQDIEAGEFPPLHHVARTCLTCQKETVKHY